MCLRILNRLILADFVQGRLLAKKRDLNQKMKLSLWAAQRFTQQNFAAMQIIAAKLVLHHLYRHDSNPKAKRVFHMGGKAGKRIISCQTEITDRFNFGRTAQFIGPFFKGRKIIIRLLQCGAHFLNRIADLPNAAIPSGRL